MIDFSVRNEILSIKQALSFNSFPASDAISL